MINNKNKRTEDNSLERDKWEREQFEFWDDPSMIILMMDALGVEIISETGYLPVAAPFYIKGSFKSAKKLSKSQNFDVVLCAENIWRIGLKGFDYPFIDDFHMIPLLAETRKQEPTKRAEEWADMMREISEFDRTMKKK
jgi:hypothetical protein